MFIAATLLAGLVGLSAAEGLLSWDVRFAYLPAAELVLDGESPYPAVDDPILEDQKGYVYPPQLVLLLVPLTVLPVPVASFLVALGMLALVFATLYVLEIRDLRCYAAAAIWVPTISGVLLGNVSIPLAFALAVVWRYRDDGVAARRRAGARRVGEAPPLAGVRVGARDAPAPHGRARRRDRRARHRRGVGGHRLRRARRVPGPARAALGHPVGAELLHRRHGLDARAVGRDRPGR